MRVDYWSLREGGETRGVFKLVVSAVTPSKVGVRKAFNVEGERGEEDHATGGENVNQLRMTTLRGGGGL